MVGEASEAEVGYTHSTRSPFFDAQYDLAIRDATKREATVKVRPLHDRILVKRAEETEQKVGAIIIPDSAKERPQEGTVVALGKGRVTDDGEVHPLEVKAGDTVLFGKYSGTEVKVDGEEFLILREDEVFGIVARG